jgi:hypothetical protein
VLELKLTLPFIKVCKSRSAHCSSQPMFLNLVQKLFRAT